MELLGEPAAAASSSARHRPVDVDAAALVLSRLRGTGPAFVDAATGGSLSFSALRQAALSLAAGLRHGLGLRRGDAVLVLSRNSLLLPQVLLGVLAAGGVVAAAADPDATPAEVAAAAHASGAVMIVAEPEAAANVAGVGVPLLLTSRSPDPRACLSAEELIDGGEPLQQPVPADPSDLAFAAYSSASRTRVAMTHADLVAAMAGAAAFLELDELGLGGRRVCLASLPICSAHGLPLIALALPAAGATTVLVPPTAARETVAAHGATDVVAAPEAAAALAGGAMALADASKLASLRRVIVVAPAPLPAEAREQFRRRLPWVDLREVSSSATEEQVQAATPVEAPLALTQTDAAAVMLQTNNSPPAAEQLAATNEAASPVPPLKKIQKIILGDIFSRSTTSKNLRKHPITGNRQPVPKL